MIDENKLAFIRADFKEIQAEENDDKIEFCSMLFLVRYGEELFETIEALRKENTELKRQGIIKSEGIAADDVVIRQQIANDSKEIDEIEGLRKENAELKLFYMGKAVDTSQLRVFKLEAVVRAAEWLSNRLHTDGKTLPGEICNLDEAIAALREGEKTK